MKFIELHLASDNSKIAVNPLNILNIIKQDEGTRIYFTDASLRARVKENYDKVLMMINDTMDK